MSNPASPPRGPLAQLSVTAPAFVQRFSSTPRGARLARRLAAHQLDRWGFPHGGALSDAAVLIVAELAANAVTHGRVTGRDFELRLERAAGAVLRIEVTDTRGEQRPPGPGELPRADPEQVGGRGLLLVEALADRWCVLDRVPPGKTVRAELDVPARLTRDR
ncbi:hypothetical protein C6N75_05625 [Streptomyces solincola]|uniref:Histidine kinase/HSP90-like ATPase domain-containing protein n=1 Tax=Streptomyces solincola TaxID=2100817 RepID=A0A2S9Q0I3_9ACTN|nr:ATP-binding protein [Streptomyces solincola]PRH80189.1 hypothetical protein C6N75_05625 [Streptomyces solincola]